MVVGLLALLLGGDLLALHADGVVGAVGGQHGELGRLLLAHLRDEPELARLLLVQSPAGQRPRACACAVR